MTNENNVQHNDQILGQVNQPEFKPGKTPHMQYGKEMLNANVDWDNVVCDILERGYTLTMLANEMDISENTLQKILSKDYAGLTFKLGARLLAIQMKLRLFSV